MSDTERRDLALRLFGTGKSGEAPGPIDAGWAAAHLTGTRQTLKRWRETGIPVDRVEDVMDALRDVLPEITKEAAPITRRLLAGVIALEAKAQISPAELASAQDEAAAIEAALEADARIAAELEASRRTPDAQGVGRGGARGGASLGSKRQKR